MFKRLFIAVILLGLIAGGIVWFKSFREGMIAQFMAAAVPPPVPVTVMTVEPMEWKPGFEAVGTAISARGVDLAIESSGLIGSIDFASNDIVTEGQVLLQIDDKAERAGLAAGEAALSVARAEADRAQTLTSRGVGAATTLEAAAAQVESALAQVAQLQTSLDAKQSRAPFGGMVGIPRVEEGQYVVPGTIYATLQDLERMYVDFTIPEQQLAVVALDQTVTVTTEVDAFSADGKIIAIEPQVDPNSRLVKVRAEVSNPSGKLLPGQFLRVRVALPVEAGVIALPQTAIVASLYGSYVYVLRKGEGDALTADQVFVQTGRRNGGQIEVTSNLAAGDQIVTSGQNRLSNGAAVAIDDSVDLTTAGE
ncbi:MAG: efflux RND transporter periplasmic adaptor subunit [Rhodobacterales bacterium]|nr:efflux RND transporter periplasmic adaptor subunit [Rhodobacterales bacterium]